MTLIDLLNLSSRDDHNVATLKFKLPDDPIHSIGDRVFDMPTQAVQTITDRHIEVEEVFIDELDLTNEEMCWRVCVYYNVTGPSDPTDDGAFPNGARCDFEVCDADKTLELNC